MPLIIRTRKLMIYSVGGGALMVLVGLVYLIFEDKILADPSLDPKARVPRNNHLSRTLIGVQVCCVVEHACTKNADHLRRLA